MIIHTIIYYTTWRKKIWMNILYRKFKHKWRCRIIHLNYDLLCMNVCLHICVSTMCMCDACWGRKGVGSQGTRVNRCLWSAMWAIGTKRRPFANTQSSHWVKFEVQFLFPPTYLYKQCFCLTKWPKSREGTASKAKFMKSHRPKNQGLGN